MHLNQVPNSTFYLTKQAIIGFKDDKIDSMGGVAKAKQFKKKSEKIKQKYGIDWIEV